MKRGEEDGKRKMRRKKSESKVGEKRSERIENKGDRKVEGRGRRKEGLRCVNSRKDRGKEKEGEIRG